MLNAEDRAELVNALKYVLLIWAVPWPAFAAAAYSISLVLHLTGQPEGCFLSIACLVLTLACYGAFSALFLRCGEFLLRVRRRKEHFETSLSLTCLMLPVVLIVFIRYACY